MTTPMFITVWTETNSGAYAYETTTNGSSFRDTGHRPGAAGQPLLRIALAAALSRLPVLVRATQPKPRLIITVATPYWWELTHGEGLQAETSALLRDKLSPYDVRFVHAPKSKHVLSLAKWLREQSVTVNAVIPAPSHACAV